MILIQFKPKLIFAMFYNINMDSMKQVSARQQKQLRHSQRQQLLTRRRNWQSEPSLCLAIFYIVENSDYSNFDDYLTALGIVQNPPSDIVSLLRRHYSSCRPQHLLNLLRLMNRLQMWGAFQVQTAVQYATHAQVNVQFRLIHQIALYYQMNGSTVINNLPYLNLSKYLPLHTEYALSYIFMVSHQPNSPQVIQCLRYALGSSDLLLNVGGLSLASSHMSAEVGKCIAGQMRQVVRMLLHGDYKLLTLSVQVLAQCCECCDEAITALMQQDLAGYTTRGSQRQFLVLETADAPSDVCQLLWSLTQHIFPEVRSKAFWLISNITGSQLYHYGCTFIRRMCHCQIMEQEDNQCVRREIIISVLNILCNLTSQAEIQQMQRENNEYYKYKTHQQYLLTFILGVLNISVEYIQPQETSFMERIIYAMSNLICITNGSKREKIVKSTLQSFNVGDKIEEILCRVKQDNSRVQNIVAGMNKILQQLEQK